MKEASGLAQGHMNPDDLTPSPYPAPLHLASTCRQALGLGQGPYLNPISIPPDGLLPPFHLCGHRGHLRG